MSKEYVKGFIDKCAAAGVDPEALIKQSIDVKWDPKGEPQGGVKELLGLAGGTGAGAAVGYGVPRLAESLSGMPKGWMMPGGVLNMDKLTSAAGGSRAAGLHAGRNAALVRRFGPKLGALLGLALAAGVIGNRNKKS